MDNAMNIVASVIILIVSLVLYVAVIASLLPRVLMRLRRTKRVLRDRGIKRYVSEGVRGVVYEPELRARKYLRQYTVYCLDSRKYVRCRIDPRIADIRYDVVVFDHRDRMIDVIGVREHIQSRGYTRTVILPPETSYVSVVLRHADGMYEDREAVVTYPLWAMGTFAALAMVLTVAESYVIHSCLADSLKLFPPLAGSIGAFDAVPSLVLGAALAVVSLLTYFLKTVRMVNR